MAKVLSVLRDKRHPRRFQRSVYLLPGMVTVGNLFCGYACIVYAMRADFATAAVFVGVATVLDVLDGRIARFAGAASEFGGQFDSLADVISFGVAPAVLVFTWGLEPLGRLGWAVGFLYVTATALRLARFNVQPGSVDKRYFIGMPSPAAAGVLASTVSPSERIRRWTLFEMFRNSRGPESANSRGAGEPTWCSASLANTAIGRPIRLDASTTSSSTKRT